MTRCTLALLAVLAIGSVACGGSDDGGGDSGSPTSPTGGGGGCNRPGAPVNVAAAVSFSSVVFSWSAVNSARDYVIMVGSTPGTSNMLSTNTTQTSYNWNGVPPGTYHVRVEARNTCGSGAPSTQVTFAIG